LRGLSFSVKLPLALQPNLLALEHLKYLEKRCQDDTTTILSLLPLPHGTFADYVQMTLRKNFAVAGFLSPTYNNNNHR
jgi:hypothetical protein